MHSFQKYPIAIILFSTMGVATAQSQILASNCEACTVQQIAKMVRSCDSGIDYVADFRSNRIYKGCSYIDVNDGTRPPTRTRELQTYSVEGDIQQSFNIYENVYLKNNFTLGYTAFFDVTDLLAESQQTGKFQSIAMSVFNVIIPLANAGDTNGKMNAYDTVVSSASNQRVIDFLSTKAFSAPSLASANPGMGPALVGAIAQIENAWTSKLISFTNFNATYIANFPDGSHRTYQIDFNLHAYRAVPGTARDAHGNVIPENASMVTNGRGTESYDFRGNPQSDMTNFVELARSYGATFGPGTSSTMQCSWNGETLHCILPN